MSIYPAFKSAFWNSNENAFNQSTLNSDDWGMGSGDKLLITVVSHSLFSWEMEPGSGNDEPIFPIQSKWKIKQQTKLSIYNE